MWRDIAGPEHQVTQQSQSGDGDFRRIDGRILSTPAASDLDLLRDHLMSSIEMGLKISAACLM